MVPRRDGEVLAYEQGRRTECPANEPLLLVVGMDGGRYQGREKDEQTQSRSARGQGAERDHLHIPGDGADGPDARKPQPLVSTYLARARATRTRSERWRARGWREIRQSVILWYGQRLAQGLPIGSGLIEGAGKTTLAR